MKTGMAAIAVLCLAGWCGAQEADWPGWRGPNRDGVTTENSGWPGGWPAKDAWRKNVGAGCTSPVMVGGRVYVMGWQGPGGGRVRAGDNPMGEDTVWCLDAGTGEVVWKQSYACRYQGRLRTGDEAQYGGPSSTPAFDGETGYLYTLSIDGDLCCWDAKAGGKTVWRKNLHAAYTIRQRPDAGGGTRDYGCVSSPLVAGETTVVEVGAEQGTVIGFDKRTGAERWRSEYRGPAGHSGGVVEMKVETVPCAAVLTLKGLLVMRMDKGKEGKTAAWYDWQTQFACNIATPAVWENRVVLTSGYNQNRTAMIEVRLGGVRQVWASESKAMVSSPVIGKGRVYLVDGALTCLDLAGGALRWRGGSFGQGSCAVTGDDNVMVFGNGRLALVKAGPSQAEYKELSRVEKLTPDTSYPHVAFSRGVVCCKDRAGNMVVLKVK